jgi:hypothetical protein
MSTRSFSSDPIRKIRKKIITQGDELVVATEQDVTDLVEENKRLYNDAPSRHGELDRVASIPITLYFDLKKKGIMDDEKKLRDWLNDNENRFFRTRPGRV